MKIKSIKQTAFAVCFTVFFSCATASATEPTTVTKTPTAIASHSQHDPLEHYNRWMFSVNETLDKYILKPIAQVYRAVMPSFLMHGIGRMFSNLNMLPTIANDLLQGSFYQATSDIWRLGINSTVGLLGFYDVASDIGLEANDEDFGLTLAKWGYTNSTYIVLPIFGPSTIRDAIGKPVDYYAFSVYAYTDDQDLNRGIYAVGNINKRAELLDYEDLYNQVAVDKYAFVRNAYLQQREAEIKHNEEPSDPYYEVHNQDTETPITVGTNQTNADTQHNQEADVIVIGGN